MRLSLTAMLAVLAFAQASPLEGGEDKKDDGKCTKEGGEGCGCNKLARDAERTGRKLGDDAGLADLEKVDVSLLHRNGLQMDKVLRSPWMRIEGGDFDMGTTEMHIPQDAEGPPRPVTVSTFEIEKYEVSNAQFAKFIHETKYE